MILYQLDYRAASAAAPAWTSLLSQQQLIEVPGLLPGTKYVFRARAGYGSADTVKRAAAAAEVAGDVEAEGITWGDFSVESSYATSGVWECWRCCLHMRCVMAGSM